MLRFTIAGSGPRHEVDHQGQIISGDKFKEFSETLGAAIARAGHQLVVLSDDPRHADVAALRGYLTIAQGKQELPPILVTRGSALDPENRNAVKFIDQRRTASITFKELSTDGEYPFNRVGIVQEIDVLIVIGGYDGAKQLVEIAYALNKTLVPISSFGGVAEQVWNRLEKLIETVVGDRKDALTDYFGRISHSRGDVVIAVAEDLSRGVPKRSKRPMTRVLSIDGGGIRGMIPAIFCEAMENWCSSSIHKMFDLVAGTSTGGILALGFASPPHGIPAAQLVKLYESRGHEIFGGARGKLGSFLAGPKYDAKGLEKVIEESLPKANLSQALIEVFITAYDLERRRPRAFKRWRAKHDVQQDVSLKDVARATSAAPTFFPPAIINGRGFVDGGLVANNPAVAAYAEAIRLWPKNEILMVSIGTGAAQQPISTAAAVSWGQAKWAVPLLDCMFSASSDAVHYALQQVIPSTRYNRFQINLTAGSEQMDDASPENITRLRQLGDDLVRQNAHALSELVTQLSNSEGAGPPSPQGRRQKTRQ